MYSMDRNRSMTSSSTISDDPSDSNVVSSQAVVDRFLTSNARRAVTRVGDVSGATPPYYFNITAAEFAEIKPDLSKLKPTLSGEWRELLYAKFYEIYPSCPILFSYCRVRKAGSRKRNSPFFRGSTSCKNCIKVDFVIIKDPDPDTDVRVDVTVIGSCTHTRSGEGDATEGHEQEHRRGRRLSGRKRVAVASRILSGASTPSKEYYRELSEMPDVALRAGNTAPCHTKAVFRQAASELRGKRKLEDDVVMEIRSQRKNWLASDPVDSSNVGGYIQAIGDTPFYASFYLREQMEMYVQGCKQQDGCVIHFDATGTVVKKISDQKRVLYYCMIPENESVPILDFLSSTHTAESITYILEMFNRDARQMNHGNSVQPLYVVTDFSYALIHAALHAFKHSINAHLPDISSWRCKCCY